MWTWPGIDPADLDPTSVTVVKDRAGRWFVSFHVDMSDPAPLPATGEHVGVDLGLTDLAVFSTGEKIPHPRDWERHERRLKRYQRRLARCQKGSANRKKAGLKVARAHAGVADARRDFLHKLSTRLSVICHRCHRVQLGSRNFPFGKKYEPLSRTDSG